jgi:hypothetical protein
MATRDFTVHAKDGDRPLTVDFVRCYNLGFTMRDPVKMQEHLQECYDLGIKELIVERPPLVMPISTWAVLTDDHIEVQRPRTSGEVEIVTVVDKDGTLYVGVGSDHTDRSLEGYDIPWGKQVAPNVVARDLWVWDEVKDHWDQVQMKCSVIDSGEEVAYQDCLVSEFWTPAEMVQGVRESTQPIDGPFILFSGTVVSLEKKLRFAESWTITMIDPVLDRRLEHTYTVTVLASDVLNDGSASGEVASAASLVGQ